MHLADAFIQSDLHCIQVTVLHFPGNTHTDKKCIAWMHCKSLWIKVSAKCINVNVTWKACLEHSSSAGRYTCTQMPVECVSLPLVLVLLPYDEVSEGHSCSSPSVNALLSSWPEISVLCVLWHYGNLTLRFLNSLWTSSQFWRRMKSICQMWLWTTKPVIRVNFSKLRFIHHLKAE